MNDRPSSITHKELPDTDRAWQVLHTVHDPEVPVLSVVDLGIVRDISFKGPVLEVTVTPTYSGCPATAVINTSIRMALNEAGFDNVHVVTTLTPPWTTDWMSDEGRRKLKEYGIAPPVREEPNNPDNLFVLQPTVQCPHCGSTHTTQVSRFGSTACKALYQCNACREPFDYFKCH